MVTGYDRSNARRQDRRLPKLALLLVVALAAATLLVGLVPVSTAGLASRPVPTRDYAAAVARFEQATSDEASTVYPPCASRLYTHGERTETAVVLVHGLTNCPRQFVELAETIHASGSNVLVLRVPYHGLGTPDLADIAGVDEVGPIRAEDYRRYADETIDIAAGLGRSVRVMGLSLGGVIAGWMAQNRDSVEHAVVIAPATGLPGNVPDFVTPLFRNFFGRAPNLSLRGGGTQLDHAYVGESSHAIAHMYLLAEALRRDAGRARPAARSIAVVTNASDTQVDNEDILALADLWRRTGATVTHHEFPAALGLPHDVVDVQQPAQRTDVVYPVLVDLVTGPARTS